MENIAMIVRKAPYGDINAAEAVRHALGAAADDIKTSLILLDSGVLLAKKGKIRVTQNLPILRIHWLLVLRWGLKYTPTGDP